MGLSSWLMQAGCAEATNPRPRADPRTSRGMLGDGSQLTTDSSSDGAGCMTAPQPAGAVDRATLGRVVRQARRVRLLSIGQAGRAVTVVQPAFAEQPA